MVPTRADVFESENLISLKGKGRRGAGASRWAFWISSTTNKLLVTVTHLLDPRESRKSPRRRETKGKIENGKENQPMPLPRLPDIKMSMLTHKFIQKRELRGKKEENLGKKLPHQ